MSHQLNCLVGQKLKGQTVPLSHSGGIVTDFNLTQILLLLFWGNFCEKDSNLLVIFHTSVFQVKKFQGIEVKHNPSTSIYSKPCRMAHKRLLKCWFYNTV